MQELTYELLLNACRPGGSSVLTAKTELRPAAGDEAGIAPARYVRGRDAAYAFETRYAALSPGGEPEPVQVVVVASKGASLNHVEAALSQAIADGDPLLSLTPHMQVTYPDQEPVTELELPHRAFDGHIRVGSVDGKPVTAHPAYRDARNVTAANALALMQMSPISLVLGCWDSTRKSSQVRMRSALVGETIGILADQSPRGNEIPKRGAARFDTIAPSVRLKAEDMKSLLGTQRDEMSSKKVEAIEKEIGKTKKGTLSAAELVLGSIPPSLTGLGFVSCRRIIRTNVLSFSALRQIRFGLGADGDAAARALLAALALNGLARSYEELYYRANCDLVEAGPGVFELDGRYGVRLLLEPLSIAVADGILDRAIREARGFGVEWDGAVFAVEGNPLVAGGIEADDDAAE